MPRIDVTQLTHPQRRVMELLAHGWTASRRYGSVVYLNGGGKIATVATMIALERRNLIIRNGDEWKALPLTEPRVFCGQCEASITETDKSAGFCTQCKGKL